MLQMLIFCFKIYNPLKIATIYNFDFFSNIHEFLILVKGW